MEYKLSTSCVCVCVCVCVCIEVILGMSQVLIVVFAAAPTHEPKPPRAHNTHNLPLSPEGGGLEEAERGEEGSGGVAKGNVYKDEE